MGNGEAKRLILSRRARFVAAAVAGIGAVAQAAACSPKPCLEPPPAPPTDAGSASDASATDAGTGAK